ncbi:kinesin, putative [Leishmania panamensis]|uniref:Kinesin, putative n=1 Tax=Leishmania panamensis TaxID=5679 RepID=A0A088S370_LEIPA|nr:kinesin, putative [Leishmania panamensis]AIN95931.1 kinesin, putative [Leishmania panamensis]
MCRHASQPHTRNQETTHIDNVGKGPFNTCSARYTDLPHHLRDYSMGERITVALRVRPFLPHEDEPSCVVVSANQVSVGAGCLFAFDHVFDETASSDDVYVALGQPLADFFLSGFHASTIAYGQTGAGKTFTMEALLSDTVQEIFCRLTEDAETVQSSGDVSTTVSVTLSVLEVYNESIGDLLAAATSQLPRPQTASVVGGTVSQSVAVPAPRRSSGQALGTRQERKPSHRRASAPTTPYPSSSLALREDPHGGVYVAGLSEVQVHSEAELFTLIDGAIGNRKTASTLMNATSSRSHCVVTLTLQRRGLCSRCCFVDLAGSERLKKSLGLAGPSDRPGGLASPVEASLLPSSTVATRMREGININSGLLALGNVIVALCEKKPYVPYRSSKLTRLLQPMLGGNARTAIVACVSQLASSLEETLNTLKYADRAKRIPINPHLAIASVNTPVDAKQTIEVLREQLEDAQRRVVIAAAASAGPRNAAGSPEVGTLPSPSTALVREVEHLRDLLQTERRVTQRLENDVFNAEYTAMIEVEKRKALEARVAQLEATIADVLQANSERPIGASADSGTEHRAALVRSPRSGLTMNMVHCPQLKEKRDTVRLEAALVMDGDYNVDDLAATSTASADDDPFVVQLRKENVAKEDQITQLQENNDVSAQLAQYERELQRTLINQTHLRAELRKAEAKLEKSEMAREQKEQEKEKLRAAYEERLRRAETRTADYCRRVKEAAQQMRERQEDLDNTRQLREKVTELREEVYRQRLRARTAQKASWQLNAAHQQEVAQLQKQLQSSTSQLTLLHQRMDRKDTAIAKVRKQLAEQQVEPQPPQQRMHSPLSLHQPPEKTSSLTLSSSRATPPSPALGDTPPRIIKARKNPHMTSPPLHFHIGGPHRNINVKLKSSRDGDATQSTINLELQELERMEKELAELLEYRRILLTAQTTDASKWNSAKEGFIRRLSQVHAALQSSEPGQSEHTALLKEKHDVEEMLRQLQAFHHMFADAEQQLAEFDNRIENLNEARKFHTQRVRRLQCAVAKPRGDSGDMVAEKHQPSVRDIRTACANYTADGTSVSPAPVVSSRGKMEDMQVYATDSVVVGNASR